MCGRFALRTSVPEVARLLGIEPPWPDVGPRYNIAPTQSTLVCVAGDDGLPRLALMRWGLVPHWAKDLRFGARTINARAETVATKPAFRTAFRRKRCLVPADGYYEWRPARPAKQPYLVHLRDGAPFFMAGLWASWNDAAGERHDTFTIVTTRANALCAPVHPRMPVILPASAHATWLDASPRDADALAGLLVPCADAGMALHPVSTYVNKAAHDDARCVEPVA